MYKVFSQKFQILIRTLHDFSIVTISEFVLLANRCMNPNVDFLIVTSKLLIPNYKRNLIHNHYLRLAHISLWNNHVFYNVAQKLIVRMSRHFNKYVNKFKVKYISLDFDVVYQFNKN